MSEFDLDELLAGAVDDYRTETLGRITPAGTSAAHATATHRKRVHAIAMSVLVAALVVAPVSAYAAIDHDHNGPPSTAGADGRNFVLCPGKAYDRSPCGTGTSAKVACLIADGKLREGEVWRQESVIGTMFEARGTVDSGKVIPEVRGTAYVNAEATLIVDDADPLAWGIRG